MENVKNYVRKKINVKNYDKIKGRPHFFLNSIFIMTTLEQYDLCHPIFIESFLFSFI
jgi:hypothetical protein